MSDSFEMLVDEDVSLLDAPAVCNKVIAVFRDIQLIVGEPTPGMGIMWMQQLYARFAATLRDFPIGIHVHLLASAICRFSSGTGLRLTYQDGR
jgi:hypothetical protein